MRKISLQLLLSLLLVCMISFAGCSGDSKRQKPSPGKALQMLKDGNDRFASGKSEYPHLDKDRLIQAGKENQGDHAYATIITCSDSRVPVEAIFDAGVMDIFVIRVAGNVCDTDEVGSIEYGLAHVNTPVMVVLGHTQCGAVTAVTKAIQGHGHALERNIPPLIDNIEPAVRRAMELFPHAQGDDVIPLAIEENVWTGIRDLFMKSPATRELVKAGKVKVAGAIYDVGNGRVSWLKDAKVSNILHEVEGDPHRAMEAMADDTHAPAKSHDAVLESPASSKIHEATEKSAEPETANDTHETHGKPEASHAPPMIDTGSHDG